METMDRSDEICGTTSNAIDTRFHEGRIFKQTLGEFYEIPVSPLLKFDEEEEVGVGSGSTELIRVDATGSESSVPDSTETETCSSEHGLGTSHPDEGAEVSENRTQVQRIRAGCTFLPLIQPTSSTPTGNRRNRIRHGTSFPVIVRHFQFSVLTEVTAPRKRFMDVSTATNINRRSKSLPVLPDNIKPHHSLESFNSPLDGKGLIPELCSQDTERLSVNGRKQKSHVMPCLPAAIALQRSQTLQQIWRQRLKRERTLLERSN